MCSSSHITNYPYSNIKMPDVFIAAKLWSTDLSSTATRTRFKRWSHHNEQAYYKKLNINRVTVGLCTCAHIVGCVKSASTFLFRNKTKKGKVGEEKKTEKNIYAVRNTAKLAWRQVILSTVTGLIMQRTTKKIHKASKVKDTYTMQSTISR